jgi:hypothetical protein
VVSTALIVILPGPTTSSKIIYRKSVDNGATFGPTIRLSNHIFTNLPGSSILPDISASGNNVYAVWVDESAGNREIFYRESSNSGTTFGPVWFSAIPSLNNIHNILKLAKQKSKNGLNVLAILPSKLIQQGRY